MVPLGPKLVLRTSWSPLAAVMFKCNAAADLATSALGLSAFTAAILGLSNAFSFSSRFHFPAVSG